MVAAWLVALAAAPAARAACEVPLPNEPQTGEEDCGPANPNPPPAGAPGTPPKLVAWASGFDLNPFNADRLGIYVAQTDGTRRRKLTSFSRSLQRDFSRLHGINLPDDHPSFSPDNRRIVFTSNRANPDNFDIYVMNVNGSGVKRLTFTAGLDTEPVFSPDGTRIAFATERFGNFDIATMDSNGQNVRRVTTSAMEDLEPAWRPDGQEIAFSRTLGVNDKDIFTINPNGTGERRVTSTAKEDHDPTYSPDGTQLVITSERNISPPYGNVHKIRVSDGADLGDLTADQELGSGDPFWSRDGTLIAYFNAVLPILRGPQQLFVMGANGNGKFRIPGEAQANIHPAIGLAIDDDRDGTPNYLESGSVGKTALRPRRVRAGRTALVRFDWTHPRRWRRLDTIWLRLSQRRWLRGMVRFSVRQRAFSLFDGETDRYGRTRRTGRGRLRSGLVTLDLRRTRVVNVDRRKIRLVLALRFPRRLAGQRFRVRVQANDRGGRNEEEALGRLRLVR
jgi:Tol biopolymer transport system component